jgi:hypothetical protein
MLVPKTFPAWILGKSPGGQPARRMRATAFARLPVEAQPIVSS